MSREKNLIKNTLILSIGTVVPKLSSFIILPILTAYLTKAEYGTYDLITILVSLFLPAVTLQLQTAAFRFLIEEKESEINKKKIISNIFIFIVPTSIIALIILFFVLFKYSIISRVLIGLYFFFDIFYNACGQIARGLSRNKEYTIGAVISSFINLLFTIVLVYIMRMGLNGVLICLCLAKIIPTIIIIKQIDLFKQVDIKLFNKDLLKELLKYSWPMVPNSMSMWVMNASDRLVVTYFLGIEANAIYAVAKKIPNIITIAQSTFTMAWQESASLASGDKDSSKYYSKMFDIIFCSMSGIMIFLLACMPILFKILIQGDYNDAYNQMPILVLGMFFYSIASYLGGIYVAKMKTKSVGITTIVSAVINLVISLIFIKVIGLYAATVSTLVSYMILAIYRMIDVRKYERIDYSIKKIIEILLVLMIITIFSYVKNIFSYIIIFFIAILFNYAFNRKIFISMIGSIKKKLKK